MWIRKGQRYVFMDQAGAGEGGGSGAAAASADGGAAASSGDGGSAGGAAGASGTAAAAGAGGGDTGTALAQAGQQTIVIPEKLQVKNEDGSLNYEASALKLSEAYGNLEKRLGSGDTPPKSPEEYQIAVPDALKDVWNPKEDPLLGEFLKEAHAAGFSQKQVDLALTRYMDLAPKLANGGRELSAEECVADLKAEWKTDEQYKAELGKAFKAATAYAGDDAQYIIDTYGNDPKVIRMLNRIGGELGEDRSTGTQGGTQSAESVQTLMASEAYSNPKHPEHAKVSRQVADYYQQQAAAAEKAGNAPLL